MKQEHVSTQTSITSLQIGTESVLSGGSLQGFSKLYYYL